MDHNF